MLRRKQKQLARAIARDVFIKGLRGEEAEAAFKSDPRADGLDPQTILILLQIAFMFWKWWNDNKQDEPSVVASELEPVNMDDDNE